jgi:hypothetical protein
VWRVETDGAGIVDQEILIPQVPVFKTVAFEGLQTIDLMMAGDLDVGGDADIIGALTVGSPLFFAVAPALGTIDFFLGDVTVSSSCTWTSNAPTIFNDDVTLGNASGDSIQVPGTPTFQTAVNLSDSAPSASQISTNSDTQLLWHDGTGVKVVHYSDGGYLRASGIVDGPTAAAATNQDLVTGTRTTAPVNLYVSIRGYALRAVAGSASFQIEQDDGGGTYSDLGDGRSLPIDDTDWTWFSLTRLVVSPDSTNRLYRLNVNGSGENIQIRDAVIEVDPA